MAAKKSRPVAIKNQARQGDVFLMRRDDVPPGYVPKPIDPRGVVLAEGDATGHHHRINDPGVCSLRAEDVGYDIARITEGVVSLVHEEHGPIPIGPGTFEIRIQREHSWNAEAEEVSRAVAD